MSIGFKDATELTSEDWATREQVLRRFEDAWRHEPRPRLEDYLPAGERQRWAVLVELVHTDLECRLKDGEPARVEEYLIRFPELNSDPEAELELIAAELELRRRREPGLGLHEFLARFPQYRAELLSSWKGRHNPGTTLPLRRSCPQCHEPLDIPADASPDAVTCPGCGAAIRLDPGSLAIGPPGQSRLGKYELLEELGRGAFGIVHRARDTELDRVVALKVPRAGHLASPEEVDRFLREARSAAQLEHPHIVAIHDFGRAGETCYLACAFVPGTTLAHRLAAGRLPFREAAALAARVAEALNYAHLRGVIHRDVKPSNILLDQAGQPHLTDFGLARRDAGEITMTIEGDILGTPAYMSPEQARGEAHRVDGRSDLYSLGVVLYELLTDALPFRGNREMVLKQLLEEETQPPRRLNDRIPRDLQTICLKCLEKEPDRRYDSARAMAEDLGRFSNGEPILARPVGRAERVGRWCRRNPWVAAFLVAMVLGVIGSTWQAIRATVAEQATRLAAANAKRSEAEALAALAQSEESRKQAEAVSTFLVEAFRSPDLSQDGRQVKVVDVLDQAIEQLDKDFAGSQATQGALFHALGLTYLGLALNKAVSPLTRARAVREAVLGPDHPDTLASCHSLARAYFEFGPLPEAIALFEATLKRSEAALGPDHPQTLATRFNLVKIYSFGREPEAIPQFEEIIKWFEVKLGPDHPQTLAAKNTLANAYRAAGRLEEAIAMYQLTLKLREAKLGPRHPETLQSRHNLAQVYDSVGRWTEAIKLHEETLRLREAALGPDHPHTLATSNNLANAYRNDGQMSKAIALFEATLKRSEAALGPDHPDTFASRNNLASAYADAGQLTKAVALFEENLKLIEARLSPDHAQTLDSLNNLATVYEMLGRWSDAEGLYRDLLARRRKAVKTDSPLLADDLAALAGTLLEQSRWSEAERLLHQCLAIREKAIPDDFWRYDAMSLLGGALLGQGRYAEAEVPVVDGYEQMKAREGRIPVPVRSRIREAAARIVRLYEAWNRPNKATEWKANLGMRDLPADVFAPP